MPNKEEIKKILEGETTWANFTKATEDGLEYYAQIIYPGAKELLNISFLIPLNRVKGRKFYSVMPARKLVKWMVI